jgi:hypothetical protein
MYSASGSITKLWAGQDENPRMHTIYRRLNDPKENEDLLTKTLNMRPSEPYLKINKKQRQRDHSLYGQYNTEEDFINHKM